MYPLISRIACNCKPLANTGRLKSANHSSHSYFIQINRSYKNFGHARDENSPLTFWWLSLLGFGMTAGCLRGLYEWFDVYEEGDDRYKEYKDKMYREDE